jgi:hypothetical protein
MGEASKTLRLAKIPAQAAQELGRTVAKSHLVNRLNYLNFQDLTILVQLRHVSYDNTVFLRARPQPCAGERLECVWAEVPGLSQLLNNYRFDYLLIPDGKKYLLVKSDQVTVNEQGVNLVLPVTCHEFQERRIKRHAVDGITVQIVQHGAQFRGEVVDFTPVSLRITGNAVAPATLQWFNPESPLNVRLLKAKSLLYSGSCRVLTQSLDEQSISLVLMVLNSNVHRYKSKRYRNIRQELVPSPNIVFEHPLIGKRINLKIVDLSGTGFAVEENEGESVLLPGLILPELKISFAQGVSVRCTVQVVFRNPQGERGAGERSMRCGIAILNMEIRDHVKLLSLLHQVENRKSYVCTDVDLDDLWDFFFETGFIYPGKYAHFQANKEKIKKIYAKLYGKNPQIARHFIYMDRGAILGHMAMVRFYRDSWMIHHHAARKTVTIKAGLAVLDQVSHYLNELENFSFAHLRFVYCYYRPDNKFPNRVFGGFARQHREPQVCSEDIFAYWRHSSTGKGPAPFPEGWELAAGTQFDLNELGNFYRFASGGLMTDAFDLRHGDPEDELAREYRGLGFKKEKRYYALRKNGSLKAFILVNCTDAGFNMADLTNCVTVMVLDQELPRALLELSLEQASLNYEGGEMPVLAYPLSYLEGEGIPFEKLYVLWILNLQYSDSYFEYCEGMFRSVKKNSPAAAGE